MNKKTRAKIISSYLAVSLFLYSYANELKSLIYFVNGDDYNDSKSLSTEDVNFIYKPDFLLPAILPINHDYYKFLLDDDSCEEFDINKENICMQKRLIKK